jgi:hypothetical protein
MSENIDVIDAYHNPVLNPTIIHSFRWTRVHAAIAAITAIFINAIYFFRLDQVVGQFGDDAWYIVLARSIAEHGTYQLINSPIQGIQPNYPPGLPLLLAILLKAFSLKPEELWLLKGISVAAMNLVGLGVFTYCCKIKKFPVLISWLVAMMVALMPAYVFLATSTVMSECVFTCFQLWAVVQLESILKNRAVSFSTLVVVIGLASSCFYTRSMGITVVAAIAIQLFRQVSWRHAAVFVLGFGIIIAPWVIYCKTAYPNNELRANHGGNIVYSYLENVTFRVAGFKGAGIATREDYLNRVIGNLQTIVGKDVLGVMLPSTLRTETRSGEEVFGLGSGADGSSPKIPFAKQAVAVSLIFAFVMLLGFIAQCREQITSVETLIFLTVGCVIIWPWTTFRFILPLAPFMICYWILGLKVTLNWVNQRMGKELDLFMLARISLFCFGFFFALEHVRYINLLRTNPKSIVWVDSGRYQNELCEWLRGNLPAESVIASTNPAKIFLSTGHLAIAGDLTEQSWNYWKESNVNYMVILSPNPKGMLDRTPEKYQTIYHTATEPSLRVIHLGDPKNRDSWQGYDDARYQYYLKQSGS